VGCPCRSTAKHDRNSPASRVGVCCKRSNVTTTLEGNQPRDRFGSGFGINTGEAVGNTGSRVKASNTTPRPTPSNRSRVQRMTKQFGVTALVTNRTSTPSNEVATTKCDHVSPDRRIAVHWCAIATCGFTKLAVASRHPMAFESSVIVTKSTSNFHAKKSDPSARYSCRLMTTHPEDVPSTCCYSGVRQMQSSAVSRPSNRCCN